MNIHFKNRLATTLFVLFLHFSGFSQNAVDDLISTYPVKFNSYQELADRIEKDFSTDEDKARAAFAWIAMNVAYNTKAIGTTPRIQFSYRSEEELQAKKKQFRKDLANKTLKSRKALCEGYATLYQEACHLMNIECEIIPGTAKRFVSEIGNKNLPSNHSWNAVKINGKWQLVDITWAAGSVDYSVMKFNKEYSPAYFGSSPKEFAMKHYPDDENWLLLNKTFSKEEFAFQPAIFNGFIGKGYLLLTPDNGFLEVKRGHEISFSLSQLPVDIQIAYHFKKEKYGQLIKAFRKKDVVSFSVPADSVGNDELIIYFNNEPALGYRVAVSKSASSRP